MSATSRGRWLAVGLGAAGVVAAALAVRDRARQAATEDEVEIELTLPRGVDARSARVTGADVRAARLTGARAVFVVRRPNAELVARADGACPRDFTVGASDARVSLTLTPLFELGPPLAQVGFDAPFAITAREGCAEGRLGVIAWRQVEGAPLGQLEPEGDGFVVRGRTRPWGGAPRGTSWGIVPVSPATRDTARLEATWRPRGEAGAPPAAALRATLDVSAAARATGVPTVAAGQALLLAGEGFRVVRTTPPASPSRLEPVTALVSRFVPERPAHYLLADAAGRTLSIRAGRHDTTSLDCGRAECHAATAANAQKSPMTHVLHRAFDGAFGPDHAPECALACHAVGEPGLDDGGFFATMTELGATPLGAPGAGAWDALPRALRRLGGVGCTACHGPATIPEPGARDSILRADVCATCHDAPPRYALVDAWRATRMARADSDPRAARDPACARCHTTRGFLTTLGGAPSREQPTATPSAEAGASPSAEAGASPSADATAAGAPRSDRIAPFPPGETTGIACAACHAPHAADAGPRLVRNVPATTALEASLDAASRLCAACHGARESADDALPAASAAIVWSGLDPAAPDAARIPGPHAALGCVACHMGKGGDAADGRGARGASHRMAAGEGVSCRPCHAEAPREVLAQGRSIAARAAAVWQALARRGATPAEAPRGAAPLHARVTAHRPRPDPRSAPALRAAALLLEDPAAHVHNAPFARALLDAAERSLGGP